MYKILRVCVHSVYVHVFKILEALTLQIQYLKEYKLVRTTLHVCHSEAYTF